jgi:hypothetical protein
MSWTGLRRRSRCWQVTGIGGDLPVAEEFRLVGLGQGLGVVHGHCGRQMPEIPLDDVNGDAGVEQAGGPGVPEPVGALEVDRAA